MKKISISLVVCILVLTSCSSNESEASDISEDLVGTWIGTDLVYEGSYETSLGGESHETIYHGEAYDITNKLTFNESPNTVVSEGSYNVKLEYTVDGISDTEYVEGEEFLENGSWELDGDELIIENEDLSDSKERETSIKILLITNDKLVISSTETVELKENGVEIKSLVKVTSTFKR
ncbi:hypothetical protein Q4566_14850 [Tamlana sp. 2_MG-2023]|uniref:hypothetical protein n=1 Tax=unclassified Tamlana TaxID=2614803 RepID=UPI0026E3D7EC|nr:MULTISPECIES: hypothetical protein [unclassified Tamlana]MDO6761488.1 hypothetical protein [Tamlana sp. 2_MG-2023]MDO6792337.1 hypothetical protein [Tamlana sp. 1_MG-2023]